MDKVAKNREDTSRDLGAIIDPVELDPPTDAWARIGPLDEL